VSGAVYPSVDSVSRFRRFFKVDDSPRGRRVGASRIVARPEVGGLQPSLQTASRL